MQIPLTDGVITVSASQLRTYGAAGFRLAEQEESRGCPRQYKAKYVEKRVPESLSYELLYGRVIHQVLYLMEEEAIGPEDALSRSWDPNLPPSAFAELQADLEAYLERGTPTDRYGTIAVEQDLRALLYEDEDFGPVYYRGILDWLGIDVNDPAILHFVDYKSNRFPPSQDDVAGDVQLKGYDWLIRQNWSKYMSTPMPRIVTHLDAIKWRDVEWRFTPRDVEAWRDWAEAVVRHMLRDDQGLPILNPGCAWCPVKDDCPAYLGMTDEAESLLASSPGSEVSDDEKLRWRDQANAMRLLLEKAVKAVDEDFKIRAQTSGLVRLTEEEFALEPDWSNVWDVPGLHEVLGERFYDVVTVGKGRVETLAKGLDPGTVSDVWRCFTKQPVGSKVVRRKRGDAGESRG